MEDFFNTTTMTFSSKDEFICDYLLSLSHISTLNGKLDITAYILMFVFVTAANIILIHGMIKTKEIKTNTAKLLLVMTITELVISLIIYILHEININVDTGNYTCRFYGAEEFFITFLGCSSTIFAFFMSLDRYLFIKKSQWNSRMNDKYPIMLIIIAFTYAVSTGTGIAIYMLIYRNLVEGITLPSVIFFSTLLVLYLFVLVAVLTMNCSLIYYIKHRVKQLRNVTNCQSTNNTHKKATTTVLWISFIQIITTLPPVHTFIELIVIFARKDHEKHASRIYYKTTWLNVPIILSSLLNAVVFVSRNEKLKTFYRKKLSNYNKTAIVVSLTRIAGANSSSIENNKNKDNGASMA